MKVEEYPKRTKLRCDCCNTDSAFRDNSDMHECLGCGREHVCDRCSTKLNISVSTTNRQSQCKEHEWTGHGVVCKECLALFDCPMEPVPKEYYTTPEEERKKWEGQQDARRKRAKFVMPYLLARFVRMMRKERC